MSGWSVTYLSFMSKGDTPCLKLSTFFVVCANLQKLMWLILIETDCGGLFPGKST